MALAERVSHSLRALGSRQPIGYVFMIGTRPAGSLRSTYEEAIKDAVEAGEATVDMTYRKTFLAPLTWVAPIWP